jgi:hypothetical protein
MNMASSGSVGAPVTRVMWRAGSSAGHLRQLAGGQDSERYQLTLSNTEKLNAMV